MQTAQPNVLARDHTLFGVCEAIGEDFGFNPYWLRVTLAVLLLWNPAAIVCGYLALGVIVALARWLVPNRRQEPVAAAAESVAEEPAGTSPDQPLPLAA